MNVLFKLWYLICQRTIKSIVLLQLQQAQQTLQNSIMLNMVVSRHMHLGRTLNEIIQTHTNTSLFALSLHRFSRYPKAMDGMKISNDFDCKKMVFYS